MSKKFILLAMAVGALVALAIPAVAGAQQLEQGGSPLSPGETVTGESSDTVTVAPALGATFACSNVTIEAEVAENTPSGSFAAGPASASGCVVNGVLPATVSGANAAIALEPGGTGVAELEFTVTSGELVCTFAGAGPITYVSGTSLIHVEAELSSPTCGPGELSGDYTLSHNGSPVTIS